MAGLTSRDLTRMRAIQEDFLYSTCTIRRLSYVSDGIGGVTASNSDTESVSCRFQPASKEQRALMAAKLTTEDVWIVTLAQSADIRAGDNVIYGGGAYVVQSVDGGHSWETAKRAIVTRAV